MGAGAQRSSRPGSRPRPRRPTPSCCSTARTSISGSRPRTSRPPTWTVADGILTVDKTAGNIETKRSFKNYQLHLEWRVPADITGSDQARGNSGVFLASTGAGDAGYELQILDSYNNKTYVNGQAGSIYKQSIRRW